MPLTALINRSDSVSSLIDAPPVAGRLPDDDPAARIIHFDATQPRKERMRKAAAGEKTPAASGTTVPPVAPKIEAAPAARPPASHVPVQRPPESASAARPAPSVSPPPTSAPSASVPPNAKPALSRADLERFLIDFVVEQTGYPAEMVELDVDLEADLGIDSIKKAQLFGELAEQFGVQPPADASELSLDDFPTLGHVVNFLEQAMDGASTDSANGNGHGAIETPAMRNPATATLPTAETTTSAPAVSSGNGSVSPSGNGSAPETMADPPAMSVQEMEAFLVNFVVEQTGYPAEMVELDVDLEADLGIDSIKKAQLFGELAEQFGIQPPADASELSLDDFPTLRHVVGFLQSATGAATGDRPVQNAASEVTSAPPDFSTDNAPVTAAAVGVAEPTDSEPAGDDDLETFLINFVVEQTGYPAEMVELDADLEADLGIDSIKKAQLFGELAEYFEVQATEDLSLDDFPTLGHVRDFLRNAPRKATV